ncbi:hypothetical protein ACNQGP_05305 [Flavobacterium sp. GT2N3]|uniref:hypothetical protein n=1 Tax=unclassified Flavobacterium TaxID=196869 RepID=UPI003AAECD07
MRNFDKRLQDLTDNEIIDIHLNAYHETTTIDFRVISTLSRLNREVRHAISFENSKYILPLIGMTTILDQLGNCYSSSRRPLFPNPNSSGIKKALYYFGNFDDDDKILETVYALRNGITHNASFISRNKYGIEKGKNYIFHYDNEQTDLLISSEEEWNGELSNINNKTITLLNPALLLNLIESCIKQADDDNKQSFLSIDLPEGKKELIHSYLHWLPK